jgi:mono/diheme cytochrome c family protein
MKKLARGTNTPRVSFTRWARFAAGFTLAVTFGQRAQLLAANQTSSSGTGPDFNRAIRPILSENCFKCHGPDEGARKANLRFDVRSDALKPAKSGGIAIVPGAAEKSELVARVSAKDPAKRMPPASTGKKLKPEQIQSLKEWVNGGAHYAEHWAYVKPARPELPQVQDRAWGHNEVDRFILARLEREKLKPAPAADRYTLIRRVALDLTGLPTTPEEADAFVKDSRPDAYERLVDDLLRRKSFGEHWARMWLDLARYADSAGYADDPPRTIWAYRDYVIRSFNENKGFDRFTIEQIGGDLLPDPTDEDQIATAFHRNTMTNNEGGTDDEEFRNAAVVDRVNTTMAVWMGTSIACAQCHHHKYDPFSQKEYFQLFALFNNSADADRSDEAPLQKIYNETQKDQLAALQKEKSDLEKVFKTPTAKLEAAEAQWEKDFPWHVVWQRTLGRYVLPMTEAERDMQSADIPAPVLEPLMSAAERSESQKAVISDWFRWYGSRELEPERERYEKLQPEIAAIVPNTVPVMRELTGDKRRVSHLQLRGNFLALGERVEPAVPAVFHPLPKGAPPDRLALARWLVDSENPLTARVMANRLWEQIFGTGLVRTVEDFGSQGELPTHPELLDWLATEFMARGWDMKAMLKLLVTSSTYRQSSRVTSQELERDPDNLLLGRGPRFRLTAEEVRDQALSVSGLLSHKMYGPPVRPAEPALGLTAAFGSSLDWKTSEGEDRYRRGLYIEWRRTNPYPSLTTFDAPTREVCALRRTRSNTPLQALVTLNDPVFVEAAQALGRRMAQAKGTAREKVAYGFKLCLARPPRERELTTLTELYQKALEHLGKEPEQAHRMATEPLGPGPAGADDESLAAWAAVGNVLLNLDEFLMKP